VGGGGVFEKRVLRKTFGPKRKKVTGDWRRVHNEELNELYLLPCITRVIKPRGMILGACDTVGYTGFW
jgi:hypothetical protein